MSTGRQAILIERVQAMQRCLPWRLPSRMEQERQELLKGTLEHSCSRLQAKSNTSGYLLFSNHFHFFLANFNLPLSPSVLRTHTRSHTHSHIHTQTHTRTRTHAHTHTHALTHTHKHTRTLSFSRIQMLNLGRR